MKRKQKKDKTTKVVALQYKKARELYHETLRKFDNLQVTLDNASILSDKYSELQLDFVTFIDRFDEFFKTIKRK